MLAAQPLANFWIFSSDYTPYCIKETKERLRSLSQLETVRSAKLAVWEHRPLAKNEVDDVRDSAFEPCSSCSNKKQPCLTHWWEHVETHTYKPAYILPPIDSVILSGYPFMLASILSTCDGASP